jgi:hypothetical protein
MVALKTGSATDPARASSSVLVNPLRKKGVNMALLGLVLSWIRCLVAGIEAGPAFQAECAGKCRWRKKAKKAKKEGQTNRPKLS